jgi:hypothetical protein
MTAHHHRESAQIFQFPVGGRAGLEGQRGVSKTPSLQPPAVADIAVGGSWYHEQAIRDDKPNRTN